MDITRTEFAELHYRSQEALKARNSKLFLGEDCQDEEREFKRLKLEMSRHQRAIARSSQSYKSGQTTISPSDIQ